MANKYPYRAGIEYDEKSIRGVRLGPSREGAKNGFQVFAFAEEKGDFQKDENLIAAFKKMQGLLAISARDFLAGTLSGKQVFAVQMPFRKLPKNEMEGALRLHIRKNLSFEAAGAVIDYQPLEKGGKSGDDRELLAVAASQPLLNRELGLYTAAGLKPSILEVFPVSVANAFWGGSPDSLGPESHVVLHLGPQVTCLVIDGAQSAFFTRSIYFPAEETLGGGVPERERDRQLTALGEEVSRSLTYYEKTFHTARFAGITLLGPHAAVPEIATLLGQKTGLKIGVCPLPTMAAFTEPPIPGKFNLAVALALRMEE